MPPEWLDLKRHRLKFVETALPPGTVPLLHLRIKGQDVGCCTVAVLVFDQLRNARVRTGDRFGIEEYVVVLNRTTVLIEQADNDLTVGVVLMLTFPSLITEDSADGPLLGEHE